LTVVIGTEVSESEVAQDDDRERVMTSLGFKYRCIDAPPRYEKRNTLNVRRQKR